MRVPPPPFTTYSKVPPGVEDWGDQLSSKTMEISSTGMTVGVRATWQPRRPRSLDDLSETGADGDSELEEHT